MCRWSLGHGCSCSTDLLLVNFDDAWHSPNRVVSGYGDFKHSASMIDWIFKNQAFSAYRGLQERYHQRALDTVRYSNTAAMFVPTERDTNYHWASMLPVQIWLVLLVLSLLLLSSTVRWRWDKQTTKAFASVSSSWMYFSLVSWDHRCMEFLCVGFPFIVRILFHSKCWDDSRNAATILSIWDTEKKQSLA